MSEDELNLALGWLVSARTLQENVHDDSSFNQIDEILRGAVHDIQVSGRTSLTIPGCLCDSNYLTMLGRKCDDFTQNGEDASLSDFPDIAERYGNELLVTRFTTEYTHDMTRLPFEYITIYSFNRPIRDNDGDIDGFECLGFVLDF